MRKSASRLAPSKELRTRTRDVLHSIGEETTSHPFRTVGLAAGAGFVLGGGLFTPLTARALGVGVRLALRLAVLPALGRGLAMISERWLQDSDLYRSATRGHGEGEKT